MRFKVGQRILWDNGVFASINEIFDVDLFTANSKVIHCIGSQAMVGDSLAFEKDSITAKLLPNQNKINENPL